MSKDEIISLKEAEIGKMNADISELRATLLKRNEQIAELQFQLQQLNKMIFGSKKERFKPASADPNQLSLFDDPPATQEDIQEEETEQITYQRKKAKKNHPGRNEIPEHFPVEEVVIIPQKTGQFLGDDQVKWFVTTTGV